MTDNLIATATTAIGAARDKVWAALVTPSAIKEYMFGADVESEWRQGSEITWKGEAKGKKYEDTGVILKFDPERTLQYSHFSPLSGEPNTPEHRHVVTIELSGAGRTTNVALAQDHNADEHARAESEKNWGAMLDGLKSYVERTA